MSCEPPSIQSAGKMETIAKINSSLRSNFGYVSLALFFVVVAVVGVTVLVMRCVETVSDYYKFVVRTKDAVQHATGDDEVYQEDMRDEAPPPADREEYSKIQSKLEQIKSDYAAYNKEFGRYVRNQRDRNPDDLMDERILSRKEDEYKYGKR